MLKAFIPCHFSWYRKVTYWIYDRKLPYLFSFQLEFTELIGLAQVQAMEKYWARPQPTTTFFRGVPGKFEVENNYGDH